MAQEEMPGPPPHIVIDAHDPLDDERRRDFDRMIADSEKKQKNS